MSDFNSFIHNNPGAARPGGDGPDEKQVKDFYDANKNKREDEHISAIFREAAKSKANGTLSDREIDAFVQMLSPRMNARQRKRLAEIARRLKS